MRFNNKVNVLFEKSIDEQESKSNVIYSEELYSLSDSILFDLKSFGVNQLSFGFVQDENDD